MRGIFRYDNPYIEFHLSGRLSFLPLPVTQEAF